MKITLIWNCKSVKYYQSGDLIPVCRWQGLMLWSEINSFLQYIYWANIYLLKITDGNTRWMCEVCWKLAIKTLEWYHWCRSGAFSDNFKNISHLAPVSFSVYIVDFEQVKFRLGSKSHRSKKPWYNSFVICKKC